MEDICGGVKLTQNVIMRVYTNEYDLLSAYEFKYIV